MFILEMLKFNILAAVVILITLLVSRLLKNKYSVRWKYWTWFVLSVLLLLPFHFTALRPLFKVTVPQETGTPVVAVPETEGSSLKTVDIGSSESEHTAYVSEALPENAAVSDIDQVADEPMMPAEAIVPEETVNSEETMNSAETMMPAEDSGTAEYLSDDAQTASVSLQDLEKGFVFIWVGGIAVAIVVRMLQHIAVNRKLGKYRHRIDAEDVLSIYIQLCRQMEIRKPPVLYHQPDLQSPLLTGLYKPSLYLPKEAYTAVELELIFLHELNHFKHKDLWYKLFLSIPGMLYWFNPAMLLMRREATRDLEALCDSRVINAIENPQKRMAYGRLLLETSMERGFLRQAAMGLNDSVTDFKERMTYMLSAKHRKNGIVVCLILACSLMLANQLVGCSSAAAESGSGSDSAQTEASASESISASQTSDLTAESSTITESVSTSQTAGLTVYETENFSFTVPEIWEGQVTGRIEAGAVAEKLILEWNGHHLATIRVDRTINKNNTGDLLFNKAWHSTEENGYHVALWVDNYGYRIHSSNMANLLTEGEKEQLLYLSTGGSITLEEANEWIKSGNGWVQTREITVDFYNETIVPYIEVKDLSSIQTEAATTYETQYFSFTIPEIWQGQVTGRIEKYGDFESLGFEWNGIPLGGIGVEEKASSTGGDIGHSNIWKSRGQNSNYWVHMSVRNYAFLIPKADVLSDGLSADELSSMLNALTDEEKEQLLYLTTGGRVTLENMAEMQSIENTAAFYEEFIVPNIEVKELPPRETDTAAAETTTFETRNFSFTIPEIWRGKVTGRLENMGGFDMLKLEWYGIHFATIQVEQTAYAVDGSTNKVWHSEEQNGYQLAIWTSNFARVLGYNELHNYSAGALDGLPDEEKKELIYLSTGGSLTLEEAIELCRFEDTVGQTHEKMVDFYYEVIVPNIIIKELP